ncbi:methyltransferase family protein [Geomicrobium sediminis]|uniref:Protein-S-isoprenylcysteine O-methyltransferase Ste14 n=1 Tax=Geomicrobium sediminis TaxID=1347788 RepID=A0ABS2PAJ9_9BACL|nr:isoprenylcysteine carboxylmethyltransferase family protein [Geomicrobium sediminis]MBM7632448.1 protein-S-isoprenylcysteine O-methyltransferase Ste14 [Geomicrobium sediminis]
MLHLLFYGLCFIWIAEFFIKKEQQTAKKDSSFYFILFAVIVIVATASFTANSFGFDFYFIQLLGVVLFGFGIFLRYWSIKSLGNAFTRGIDAKQDMVLSSKGPYQLLRHPLYVGLALIVFGFALFMQSPIAMMMSVSLFPFALWVRIRKEESALQLTLKGRYDQWKKKRWVVIPWIY